MEHVFFCIVVNEDAKHGLIACSVAKAIWVVIPQSWASITRSILPHFKWVIINDDKAIPMPSYHVVFD